MKAVASIYIPYAPHHAKIRLQAIASAERQTLKCKVNSGLSPNTPATFRNIAKFADTPFVVWLDADDRLEVDFVERCLERYETGKYVYTSWYCDNQVQKPNLCVARGEESLYHSHLVTTLYPTSVFKALNGFNENLPGHEDVDFYLRSASVGVCGVHLDKPLVHYTNHGQRSELFAQRQDKKTIMDEVYLSNGGQQTIMACCGGKGLPAVANPGEAKPGDVQAEALWAGMRSEYSTITGRLYVGGNGSVLNVAPADVDGLRDRGGTPLFRKVQNLRDLAPERTKVLKESGIL
jgi:hypothetical protein